MAQADKSKTKAAAEAPIDPGSIDPDELIGQAGSFEAYSPWMPVTQDMIDRFADATHDHQFIHVDPERANAETEYGGTIAHGFLTLSLLSAMAYAALPRVQGAAMGINYGFDKVRFLAPVRAGADIRAVFRLNSCERRRQGELLSGYDVTVEIKGEDTPALVAEWYGMAVLDEAAAEDGG